MHTQSYTCKLKIKAKLQELPMASHQLLAQAQALTMLIAVQLFALLCNSQQARGINYPFVREAVHAPPVSFYDYIIVGGGTAGCPLAATLSQCAHVLLLERGGSPYNDPRVENMTNFAYTLADMSPGSPAQRFVSEDGVINARARALGGGTCINAGFYSRAEVDFVRRAGWDSQAVEAAYQWVEKVVVFKPNVGPWQSALRKGLVEVGVTPDNGFMYEHLQGTKVGGTIFDGDGRRHTAADLLQYARADGLDVLLRARVAKILFTVRGRRPMAYGVMFHDCRDRMHVAYLNEGARNEVILSAGAIGSPQLLMLSGVGPAGHLGSFGIPVVLDHPDVGQGMADNPLNGVFVPSPRPVEVALVQVVGITKFGSYIEGTCGSNGTAPGRPSLGCMHNLNYGMFAPQTGQLATVPPKQRTTEAIARATEAITRLTDGPLRGGNIFEKVTGPLSTGHLALRTLNPDDNPSVTFNYFSDPEDLRRCVAGVSGIRRVLQSNAFAPFTYPNFSIDALLNITADFPMNLLPQDDNNTRSLEQFCKDTVLTIWHYHGGCQVGRVVDPNYRVLGVDALRVIDGSTFNSSPGTNPQATVMMLGRYMGVKIQKERLSTEGSDKREL